MAKKVNRSSADKWYHEKAVSGSQMMLLGILVSLTAVGLVVGLPLLAWGYSRYKKAPGPVTNVEIEED